MQRLIPLLAFALVIGACASAPTQSAPDAGGVVATTQASDSAATSDPTTNSDAESSSAPTTTADGAPAPTTAPTAVTDFEGAPAPDFRLALADGSDFVLSDEAKPVYMIFWAEW